MLSFYAIEQGSHDSWQIHYVLATSLEDAADRYIKSVKKEFEGWLTSEHYKGTTITATAYATDFDEFGVLQREYHNIDEKSTLKFKVPY